MKTEPEISYPALWQYCIIGQSEKELLEAAFSAFDVEFSHERGNKSTSGKYQSLKIQAIVRSKAHKDELFAALKKDNRIKFVL